uniref:Uncharacterized protein n=1 Tax=Setaria italica TaxID=4555 RepID=K3YBG4_SETIT
MRCDRPCPVHLYISGRSVIAGCRYVNGRGHESTLILGQGYVVGLEPRVEKVVHPCRVLIYCNSHTLGH